MMGVKIQSNQLIKKLKALERGVRHQSARAATAKAATHLRDKMKPQIRRAAAPYLGTVGDGDKVQRNPGDLAKTLIAKNLQEARAQGYFSQHKVVFRRKDLDGIGNIAHLIERGVRPHTIAIKRGIHAGRVFRHPGHPAYPFLQKTVDNERGQVHRIMENSIKADLRRLWGRK
ncbi:hypothetical protein [Conchiformibius steedae]|uniref:hypothetical protein n=1 Tax=Conchiformibius steedae TaxID=153493 RepID=UPI0026ED012E|nr:hypothetical protein [Conchiformibius steedae]